ncbi:hypothetical protein D3C78_1349990 [compost metagenome]
MKVMRRRIERRRLVALRAQRIALYAKLLAMGLVAVAARHAGGEHAALGERRGNEHLLPLLAVGMVEARLQQYRPVVIQQGAAWLITLGDLRPA